MVIFAGAKVDASRRVPFPPPGSVPFNKDVADANPGTFYSAMSNIDFKIGKGNPAATAIRFHAAQHAYLSHMSFDIGSGLAGLYQVANEAEDLHFKGGRYGILPRRPSPAWGFVLLDSTFEGQRDAAIREHEAGLTLVNVRCATRRSGSRSTGAMATGCGARTSGSRTSPRPGVVISNEASVYTQVGFENATWRQHAGVRPLPRQRQDRVGAGAAYRSPSFNHGLTVPGLGQMGETGRR
jgi:hypothetical protein